MFLVGGIFLVAGVFLGRPYCRWLCPYGVLLGWMSRFSKWHAKVTPASCVQCRLCEEGCPYNAISAPTPEPPPRSRREGARRLGLLLLATPIIIACGAWTGLRSHEVLARLHPTTWLAERITAEDRGEFTEMTLETEAFRSGGKTLPQLYREAEVVRGQFRTGSMWLGAFLGLVVAAKLLGLSVIRRRSDYEADRSACVSCARCFAYCPVAEEIPNARIRMETFVLCVIKDAENVLFPSISTLTLASSSATRSDGSPWRCENGMSAVLASESNMTAPPPNNIPTMVMATASAKQRA
jgi:NosR/NirI family nitrous oxide reductase transcriptional regulator